MIGGFGGFLGPYLTGWLRDRTHSFAGGLYGIGALAMAAALLALAAPKRRAAGVESHPSR
jgi:ACS family tartrate transporter-like MFS transporter